MYLSFPIRKQGGRNDNKRGLHLIRLYGDPHWGDKVFLFFPAKKRSILRTRNFPSCSRPKLKRSLYFSNHSSGSKATFPSGSLNKRSPSRICFRKIQLRHLNPLEYKQIAPQHQYGGPRTQNKYRFLPLQRDQTSFQFTVYCIAKNLFCQFKPERIVSTGTR